MIHSSDLALRNAKQCRELARTSLSGTAQHVLEEMAAEFERTARSLLAGEPSPEGSAFDWSYGARGGRL